VVLDSQPKVAFMLDEVEVTSQKAKAAFVQNNPGPTSHLRTGHRNRSSKNCEKAGMEGLV